MSAAAWFALAGAQVGLLGVLAFLEWWARGPGQHPRYARPHDQPPFICGKHRAWELALKAVSITAGLTGVLLKDVIDWSFERSVFWACVVLVGGQLLWFALLTGSVTVAVIKRRGDAHTPE